MSYAFQPSAADVRNVRPFKMVDDDLDEFITLAETSTYNFLASSAIPSNTARKHLWALMAAHLATVMREPEPESVRVGPTTTSWGSPMSKEALEFSTPGREFLARWKRYNRGWVLR